MKIKNITKNTGYLKVTDLENFFDISMDVRRNYVYNLNKGVYINFQYDELPSYVCDYDMHWPLISYKLYGTTRLAWLLLNVNRIGPDGIFSKVLTGQVIKYLPKDSVQSVVKTINGYDA